MSEGNKVSISSTFYVQIFHTNVVSAAFSSCMYVVKAAETTFVQKTRAYNVDEIDGRRAERQKREK